MVSFKPELYYSRRSHPGKSCTSAGYDSPRRASQYKRRRLRQSLTYTFVLQGLTKSVTIFMGPSDIGDRKRRPNELPTYPTTSLFGFSSNDLECGRTHRRLAMNTVVIVSAAAAHPIPIAVANRRLSA